MNSLVALRDTALRRRNALDEDDPRDRSLIGQAMHMALTPVRVATSRPAIKAYLTTLLFFLTSSVLVSISTTAYLFFYYNYIPQIGLTQTIYLQYDANVHPHASISIDSSALISQQPYDIYVSLNMPRNPANMAAGNFMLDLSLLADPPGSAGPLSYLLNTTAASTMMPPLARSRRPAILPYSSPVTSLSYKLLHLPIHLLSFRDLDTSSLKVSMFEKLSFSRGRTNIPSTAYLEVQSQQPPTGCPPTSQPVIGFHLLSAPAAVATSTLQIYSAELHFHARFEGLRFYVYNYRIASFLVFTSLFYTFAVVSMAIAYAFITALISARNPNANLPKGQATIKNEDSTTSGGRSPRIKSEGGEQQRLAEIKAEEDDSDLEPSQLDSRALAGLSSTERTFPTVGRNAQPLRYTPSTTTAQSDDAESSLAGQRDDITHDAEDEDDGDAQNGDGDRGRIITPISVGTQDIKDEDSDEDGFRGDSGLGTSMESENIASGQGLVRRRSSRGNRSQGR